MPESLPACSAGLGLRRVLLDQLIEEPAGAFDFLECAPDNWIGVGGPLADKLAILSSRHPLSCHGLSLSLGGPDPLDMDFVRRTRDFLVRHQVAMYSEHLSYCAADGHLYDLLPIPFTDEAVHHVAGRIAQVQDALGRRIAVENVSYYAAPFQALAESDFINAVLAEVDCDLLLDVNNVYVNAINHRYDARASRICSSSSTRRSRARWTFGCAATARSIAALGVRTRASSAPLGRAALTNRTARQSPVRRSAKLPPKSVDRMRGDFSFDAGRNRIAPHPYESTDSLRSSRARRLAGVSGRDPGLTGPAPAL